MKRLVYLANVYCEQFASLASGATLFNKIIRDWVDYKPRGLDLLAV